MSKIRSSSDVSWFEQIPKVELHLHLEGAIPHDVLWELLQKYGGDPAIPTKDALAARFAYRDFSHFLDMWTWKNGFLRQYEDFEFIAAAVAKDLAGQNIRYVEAFFLPSDFLPAGLEPEPLTEAIRSGLRRVPEVEVTLVADLVRDYGPDTAQRTLPCLSEVQSLGVVGIGIGGSEHKFPPEPLAPVYQQARNLGFQTSAHAEEAAGPESIWGAIRSLAVDRLGHATRAVKDPNPVAHLAKKRIPLELCVLSNVRTGVVPDVARHPARLYYEAGIPLSINTDDPKMFGTSLADEYGTLHRYLGFSRQDIQSLVEQGIETSWLPEARKGELLAQFRVEFAVLGQSAV
ncbi:MAG TPA: adenosine deaminase [Gemmataceae bacterium]|nr:adenosine deaminase [Gemmataceae bacterium]